MKYTITRALSELKTLKARYAGELSKLNLIAVKHGNKLRNPNTHIKAEDFESAAQAQIQSVEAILKRIYQIKTLIDKSNALREVTIGKEKMTVEVALIQKSLLYNKQDLLSKLRSMSVKAQRDFDAAVEENRKRVEEQVKNQQTTGTSRDPELEKKVLDSIENLYKVEMVDSTNLSNRIETLEREIEDFESNVDFALSESNSTTYIEVDD